MPRRPRPISRQPPQTAPVSKVDTKPPPSKQLSHARSLRGSATTRRPPPQLEEPSEDDDSDLGSEAFNDEEEEEEDGSQSNNDASDMSGDEDEEDIDVDAPRIAQWVDEEDIDEASVDESEASSESEEEEGPNATSLQSDLAALPFGTLRKAQRALAQTSALHGSGDEDGAASEGYADFDEEDSGPEETSSNVNERERGDAAKPKDIPKRKHKHAPVEMSSKKPVPRKKLVSEEKKPVPRDPRFLQLAGEFSAQRFKSQYDFLAGMHHDEMKTLRDNLKRARKLLINSPRDLRPEREAEVERLERALKRAESLVNKDKREKIELEALSNIAKQEREKRKQGKGEWFMKESDKKEALLRAKYDALAAEGGKRAVKKAIEKKQKKVSQKEKKRRPFAADQTREDRTHSREAASGKRPRSSFGGGGGGGGGRPAKRPRIGP